MNPSDVEIFSLCQNVKLATLLDRSVSTQTKMQVVLPNLLRNLSPGARGRINRDLNRASSKTLLKSFQQVHTRITEIIEIHQAGAELDLQNRVERMLNLFKSSPIHIQVGGECLNHCENNEFQRRMGSFWVPEDSWQNILEDNTPTLTFYFQAKTPSIHHWVYEVLFAHGFNPISVQNYEFALITEITTNSEIDKHTPSHILSLSNLQQIKILSG